MANHKDGPGTFTAENNPGGQPGNRGNPSPPATTQFGKNNPGRPAGSKSRTTLGKEFVAKEGTTAEERPLAFFLNMQHGQPFQFLEWDAAKGAAVEKTYYPTVADMKWGAAMAAPYMHPKLANIEHTGNVNVVHEDFVEKLLNEENGGDATRH